MYDTAQNRKTHGEHDDRAEIDGQEIKAAGDRQADRAAQEVNAA